MKGSTNIIIHRSGDPFARIPKAVLDDENLTWKAKGILCYLLGKPTEWRPQVQDLCNRGPDGEAAVRAGLKELRDKGYAKLERMTEGGKITAWVLRVSDTAGIFQNPGFPDVDFPDLENRPLNKIQCTENEGTKNEKPPLRRLFTDLWCSAFKERFGADYAFQGSRDGKAVTQLLAAGLGPAEAVDLARQAWAQSDQRTHWHCANRSQCLNAFADSLNMIRVELGRKPEPNGHRKSLNPNDRFLL